MRDVRIGVVQMVCRVGETEANLQTIERFAVRHKVYQPATV